MRILFIQMQRSTGKVEPSVNVVKITLMHDESFIEEKKLNKNKIKIIGTRKEYLVTNLNTTHLKNS